MFDIVSSLVQENLYRYVQKGTLSLVQWRLYWCVLKGRTLYVFKSKDVSFIGNDAQYLSKRQSTIIFSFKDKNQEVEMKLEGKNVSPAPDRRK
jgi:hypothetical protein